jgi:hypothetical protein
MSIKSRDVYDYHHAGTSGDYSGGVKINPVTYIYENRGFERLVSEGHRGWADLKRGKLHGADIGGGFSLQRVLFTSTPAVADINYIYGLGSGWWYNGEIHANRLGVLKTTSQLPDAIDKGVLNIIGTKGIAKNPVAPHGNLGQFLGELHDLPKLAHIENFKSTASVFRGLWHDLRTNRGLTKAVAKNYLNYEFGWKPFVQDLQDYFSNLLKADKNLRQLARDNGKTVNRRSHLPEEITSTSTNTTGYFTSPSLVSYLYAGDQQQYKTETYERYRWFSGTFRYWIPQMVDQPFWSVDSVVQQNRLSRVCFGASMTPDLLWQLMPWSWLADWGGNVGNIISNATDIELNNLVIEHAYAMCTERTRTSWAVSAPFKGVGLLSMKAEDLTEVKGRAPASPFGFGVDMTTLNSHQYSILAAIGLSRGR